MAEEVLEKLDDFFAKHKLLSYRKDEMIIREDAEPSGVYYLISGFVRLGSVFADGGELTLNIFKPGSFFPMIWAIGETKNSFFCQAMSPVKVYKTPRTEVIKFVKENQDVLFDLTKRILIGMDRLIVDIQYMLFGNSYNRIAAAILLSAKRFGEEREGRQIMIDLELTHQDIANLAGVTRETASIAIEHLKKKYVIRQLKKKFIVNDIEKLEEETFVVDNNPEIPATI